MFPPRFLAALLPCALALNSPAQQVNAVTNGSGAMNLVITNVGGAAGLSEVLVTNGNELIVSNNWTAVATLPLLTAKATDVTNFGLAQVAAVTNALAAQGTAMSNVIVGATNTLWTNALAGPILYVRTNGNDATAVAGDIFHPWRNVTSAVGYVNTNLSSGSGGVVDVGVGVFNFIRPGVTNSYENLYVSNNVTIMGHGWQTILNQYSLRDSCLVLAGNNIILRDFQLGTNAHSGLFWQGPIIPQSGTNCLIDDIEGYGDSDFFYFAAANGVGGLANLPWTNAVVQNCHFYGGYDLIDLYNTNSSLGLTVKNCIFDINSDPNFSNAYCYGIQVQSGNVLVADCIFNVTNGGTGGTSGLLTEAYGTGVYTVQGNVFNLINTVHPGHAAPIIHQGGVINVKGSLPTNGVMLTGGTVNYDSAQFAAVAADSLFVSNVLGVTGVISNCLGAATNISSPGGSTNWTATTTNIQTWVEGLLWTSNITASETNLTGWSQGYPSWTNFIGTTITFQYTITNQSGPGTNLVIFTNSATAGNGWFVNNAQGAIAITVTGTSVCGTNAAAAMSYLGATSPGADVWVLSGAGTPLEAGHSLSAYANGSGGAASAGGYASAASAQAVAWYFTGSNTNTMNNVYTVAGMMTR